MSKIKKSLWAIFIIIYPSSSFYKKRHVKVQGTARGHSEGEARPVQNIAVLHHMSTHPTGLAALTEGKHSLEMQMLWLLADLNKHCSDTLMATANAPGAFQCA